MSLSDLISQVFYRKHRLYSCGYVKNRRRIFLCEHEKSLQKVASHFKKIKHKYKSAFFKTHIPIHEIAREIFDSPNVILEHLEKLGECPDFCGDSITTPLKFGK